MLQWADVLKDKSLRNLPYKVELDKRGRVILTPWSNRHGMLKAEIGAMLIRLTRKGAIILGCSIETLDNVKVADVAWASREFLKTQRDETPFTLAPEICVEIASVFDPEVIAEKIILYLAKGAREVWICDAKGNLEFHNHLGKLKKSKLAPRFPSKVRLSGGG